MRALGAVVAAHFGDHPHHLPDHELRGHPWTDRDDRRTRHASPVSS